MSDQIFQTLNTNIGHNLSLLQRQLNTVVDRFQSRNQQITGPSVSLGNYTIFVDTDDSLKVMAPDGTVIVLVQAS